MAKHGGVYLLELYGAEPPSLRGELEAVDGLLVLGLLTVPVDEAILCLLAAETERAEVAIHEVAERFGPRSRLLRVRWTPLRPVVASPEVVG